MENYQEFQRFSEIELKPRYAKCVVEMYEYLKEQKESVIKGFEKGEIMAVVKSSQDIYRRHENPFDDRTWIKFIF